VSRADKIIEGFKLGSLGAGKTKYKEPESEPLPIGLKSIGNFHERPMPSFDRDCIKSAKDGTKRIALWHEDYSDGRSSSCNLSLKLVHNPFKERSEDEGSWHISLFVEFWKQPNRSYKYLYLKFFENNEKEAERVYESLLPGIEKHGTFSIGLGPDKIGKSIPNWSKSRF
jgi:hypothetical protein